LTPEQRTQISALVSKLKEKTKTPEEVSTSILNYFSNGRFNYTLSPGSQPQLNLHEFLFKTKKGYCEHFASAMALLFRLSGVPARVIVGYHGGEFNPVGNFWTIRQKDSHAWVEFLNSQSKWTAVDPVVVVAPQRIELGSNLYSSIVNDLLTEDEIKSRIRGGDTFSRLSMWFDNVNYRWSSFLLEYDFDKQKDILRSLNLSLGSALIVVLIILFVISVAINLFQKRGLKRKFSELCFEEINLWASRFDLQKKETEGPISWKERLISKLPDNQKSFQAGLEKAFSLWIQMSYQQTVPDSEAKRSLSEIRRILKQKN
jgi:hypothetical protein